MFEEFKKAMARKKLSQTTIDNYVKSLTLAQKFIGRPLETAEKKDIEKFLDSIADRKSNTILARLISLKVFFKWLGKPEIADFPRPKKEGNSLLSSDLLTEEDVLKLIEGAVNPRDKALFYLLYDSACRKSEILGLNIKDLVIESEKTGYICVDGKTGKRQVPISLSISALSFWMNCHPLKSNPEAPLFIATKQSFGHRLSDSTLEETMKSTARRVGIKKRIFCHLFRHSRLTQLDRKGLSHTAMKNFAGWSKNSNMPSVYSHFSDQDTRELIYEADGIAQPKAKKKPLLEPVNCPKCKTSNDKTNRYCFLCGMALDDNSRKEFEIEELVKVLIKTNPDISKAISEKISILK